MVLDRPGSPRRSVGGQRQRCLFERAALQGMQDVCCPSWWSLVAMIAANKPASSANRQLRNRRLPATAAFVAESVAMLAEGLTEALQAEAERADAFGDAVWRQARKGLPFVV